MMQKVIDFPSQVSLAFENARNNAVSLSALSGKISNIVILGMGASGVVGDFVSVLLRNSVVPVTVQKNAALPAFTTRDTLVISISYSGRTRETLEALNNSIMLGAKNVVLTSSFELGSVCTGKGIPCVQIPENGFPRATLGFMLVTVMDILSRLGLIDSIHDDVQESISLLVHIRSQCGPDVTLKSNPARLLAHSLAGRFPVLYGESDFTEVVAFRWKQQLNENAKTHCYYDVFPELFHNEIESWHTTGNGPAEYALLVLRDAMWERQSGLEGKIEATKRLAESKGAKVFDLWTTGKSELARLLSLCYLGDFVSVYLALARDIDPGPVTNIELLKKVGLSNSRET